MRPQETLTMQQVADLAGVRRPVVSTWRRRSAGSDSPFPTPVDSSSLVFDADEVGRWLEETGRGNNREARADALLHSTLADAVAVRLADASALLLLHALSGSPLSESDPDDVLLLLAQADVDPVLSLTDAASALDDTELTAKVDTLAEAGVTASRVLGKLVAKQEKSGSRLGSETLTDQGDRLLTSVVSVVAEDSERALVPRGPGGLRLLVRVLESLPESGRPRIVAPGQVTNPVDQLLWRYLAALGVQFEPAGSCVDTLVVGQWISPAPADAETFFDDLDRTVIGLEPGSAALVVAPSPLLVDRLPNPALRRRVLGEKPGGYLAPLRYVARLPAGLCRFGGRRRLALWALGHPCEAESERQFTTFGEHAGHALDDAENSAVAHDIAAALQGGGTRRSHAFLRSAHRVTEAVVALDALALPLTDHLVEDGGDALARLWEKRDASASGVLDGVEVVAAGSAADHSLPWRAATTGKHRPARVITGVRIPAEVFAAGPGGIGVIGPDEVRGQCAIGSRSVGLVELVRRAPRFRLTEPGDVVFTTTRGPAAIIDTVGGNAVQAPARILRCLEPVEGSRRILPELAVRDISAARGSDCRSWRLRTVVVDACSPWRTVAARAAEHRARLLAELRALDALTTELSDGLAAGTLRIDHKYSDQNYEENA